MFNGSITPYTKKKMSAAEKKLKKILDVCLMFWLFDSYIYFEIDFKLKMAKWNLIYVNTVIRDIKENEEMLDSEEVKSFIKSTENIVWCIYFCFLVII